MAAVAYELDLLVRRPALPEVADVVDVVEARRGQPARVDHHRYNPVEPVLSRSRHGRRDESTQNSLPSGSARTTHDCAPCPTSAWVAPSDTRRSTSASRSPGRKSRWSRFLMVFASGTETKSRPGRR